MIFSIQIQDSRFFYVTPPIFSLPHWKCWYSRAEGKIKFKYSITAIYITLLYIHHRLRKIQIELLRTDKNFSHIPLPILLPVLVVVLYLHCQRAITYHTIPFNPYLILVVHVIICLMLISRPNSNVSLVSLIVQRLLSNRLLSEKMRVIFSEFLHVDKDLSVLFILDGQLCSLSLILICFLWVP